MVLHLSRGLVASLDSVDGLARGALEAAVLIAVVVHGNEALEVVLVPTLHQAADRLGPSDASNTGAFVAGRAGQGLHADGAILEEVGAGFHVYLNDALSRGTFGSKHRQKAHLLGRVANFLKVPLHHLFWGFAYKDGTRAVRKQNPKQKTNKNTHRNSQR